jgi:hypothetical protein
MDQYYDSADDKDERKENYNFSKFFLNTFFNDDKKDDSQIKDFVYDD